MTQVQENISKWLNEIMKITDIKIKFNKEKH